MNCGKVQNLLSCYIDRELPGVEMLQVQRHLDVCPECRREYQTLLMVKRLLSEMPVVSLPESLEERLIEKVMGSPAPVRSWALPWLHRSLWRPIAVAAAVAAIALGVWYLGGQMRPSAGADSMAAAGWSSEFDQATIDAYLSGSLRLRQQPFVPAEIPLYPYDNRASVVSVRYYR